MDEPFVTGVVDEDQVPTRPATSMAFSLIEVQATVPLLTVTVAWSGETVVIITGDQPRLTQSLVLNIPTQEPVTVTVEFQAAVLLATVAGYATTGFVLLAL